MMSLFTANWINSFVLCSVIKDGVVTWQKSFRFTDLTGQQLENRIYINMTSLTGCFK